MYATVPSDHDLSCYDTRDIQRILRVSRDAALGVAHRLGVRVGRRLARAARAPDELAAGR
jgi:hypothetical protein